MATRVGIRREDKSPWERRVPLIPDHVRQLRETAGLIFLIQPSGRRIFSDEAFRAAGALVDDDLSTCDLILGIKEIPPAQFLPGKTYAFFSHTIKGQPHNMPMLQRLLDLKCRLIDYERITAADGRRLIFFGRHAGLAGMLDALGALGQRLAWEGWSTPLQRLRPMYTYPDLDSACAAMDEVAAEIARVGLPAALTPGCVGFAGYGNVSRGAQEIFDRLPHEEIAPHELERLAGRPAPANRFFKVVFREEDLVEPIDESPFGLQDYYAHPERYRSRGEKLAPHLLLLVNGLFWAPRYPRLVTRALLRDLFFAATPRLRVIADISCDIGGAIECTLRCNPPDRPVYCYDPFSETIQDGVAGHGPVILAVDILPAELPCEASIFFSQALLPFVPALAGRPSDALPEEIQRAVICSDGALLPDYAYLQAYLVSDNARSQGM